MFKMLVTITQRFVCRRVMQYPNHTRVRFMSNVDG